MINKIEYIHSLPSHIVKQLSVQNESGMGYQVVELEYTNMTISDVVVVDGRYTSEDYTQHGVMVKATVTK